jgi:hypothetical protein
MALAPCIAADVGLQFAQHPLQSDRIAGLGGGEQGCIDPDHRGPSSEQATINAPPSTRAQLSLEPMFLR